jgi:hypothetical protein
MMLQVDIPDSLARQVMDLAANQHVSANQVVAAALTAYVGAWQVRDDIETRQMGKHGDVGQNPSPRAQPSPVTR